MVFQKQTLRELVNNYGQRMDWREFIRLAKMPPDNRPSYRSMGIIYGPNEKTIKGWFQRYDKGEKK